MKKILCHLFFPHESNNYRAKILHHSSILLVVFSLFVGQFFLHFLKNDYPAVLGASIDISIEQLVDITNKKRQEENLPPLVLNDTLSTAASLKADDMFTKNYWAHNAPDGTTPWSFFRQSGYSYVYAGENLARGFTSSQEVVDAWMGSPSHRENMLSGNYQDIGFAIKKGNLLGEETILVVEMFGNTTGNIIAKAPQVTVTPSANILPAVRNPAPLPNVQPTAVPEYLYAFHSTSLINSRALTLQVSLFIIGLFLCVFIADMVIIERKKIVRIVGHNADHIFFLCALFIVVIIASQGVIL